VTVPEPGPRSIRVWALVLLVAIAAVGFRPFFLQVLGIDREVAIRTWDDLPYRRTPGLQSVCVDVRRLVPRGANVAFKTPYPGWWDGYSFTYMRAAYLLADYRLLPLVDDHDRNRPEFLDESDWAIVLGDVRLPGFERVAGSEGATLMKKVR